jgi:hypothetical protein
MNRLAGLRIGRNLKGGVPYVFFSFLPLTYVVRTARIPRP